MPPPSYRRQTAFTPTPTSWMAASVPAAVLTALLPGGRWSDMLALLATAATLFAAREGRNRDMLVAAGLAAGLAPAGLLLAPLCVGLAFRRHVAGYLPVAIGFAVLVAWNLPWTRPGPALFNLSTIADLVPPSLAPITAIGAGIAACLGARASTLPAGGEFAEARLGALLLAGVLPLPLGALGFILMLAVLPLPSPRQLHAANDNVVVRRTVRLAA